jgi:phage terminase small subunit
MTRVTAKAKRQRFVAEYLIDLNATQAAIRAGYSRKTAGQKGFELLKKADIAAAVATRIHAQTEQLGLTADQLREQNTFIALSDPIDIIDAAGNLLPLREMPRRIRCAIRSIEVVKRNLTSGDGVTDLTYRIQFWDKLKAIELEYRRFGLLKDVHEMHHRVTLEALVAGSMDEAIDVTPTAVTSDEGVQSASTPRR